jgi:hypothetical protein
MSSSSIWLRTLYRHLYLPEMLSARTVYVLSFASRDILHVRAPVAALRSNVCRRRMKININLLYWWTNGHAYWHSFPPTTKNVSLGERDQRTNRIVRKKVRRGFYCRNVIFAAICSISLELSVADRKIWRGLGECIWYICEQKLVF